MRAPSLSLKEAPVSIHLILPLLLLQLVHQVHTEIRSQLYHQQSLCSGMVLASDHRFQTHSVRSLVQCLSVCLTTEGCVSVVHEPYSRLCHLGDSMAWQNCSNMEIAGSVKKRHYEHDREENHTVAQTTCQNGGKIEKGVCVCQQPYIGVTCEVILRDCSDAAPYSNDSNQYVTNIQPASSPHPFPVLCHVKYGRTFILRNVDGLSFNRSWQDYVNGFGDGNKDHWLGLEHLYHITLNNRNYKIKLVVTLTTGSKIYFEYDSFYINGSAEGYTFYATNGNYLKKNAHDCLGPLLGAAFSTYDHDNDGSAINCAQRHGFGWWFQGDQCSSACLPLGNLNKVDYWWSGNDSDAHWYMESGKVSIAEFRIFLSL